jgi:Tfp pilus assembly protein PilN
MVVFKGKPIFSRSISIGAGHFLTERDRYQARFIDEIKGSLEAYQNEDIERVPKSAVMTGAIADVGYLETPVAEALRLPLTRSPYLKNATLSQAALNAITVANKLSFLSLVACLVARKDLRVSLVPEEIKLRRAIEQRGRDLIKTGIFMLLVFMLLFLILLSKIHFKSAYLEQLSDEQKVLSLQARALEKDLAKINLIKGYLAKRGVSLEVLTALYELAPQEVQLSDIRFDEQAKFTIRGTATSMSAVFSFVDSMDKSKYFKNVKTKYTTKRKEGLKDVTDFEINCLLRLDEK